VLLSQVHAVNAYSSELTLGVDGELLVVLVGCRHWISHVLVAPVKRAILRWLVLLVSFYEIGFVFFDVVEAERHLTRGV